MNLKPGDLIQLNGPNNYRSLTVYDVKLKPYGHSHKLYKTHLCCVDTKTSTHVSLWEFELYELMRINESKIYKVLE